MDLTKQFFDSHAERWDDINHYDRQPEAFRSLVTTLGIKQGSKVVDLGCGTGIFIPYLLDCVGSSGLIYAVDPSDKMLRCLSQKFESSNIRPAALKAESLSQIRDTVDAVLCFSAFPHIEDKRKAISEISKVLKPAGKLLIAHFSSRERINAFHSGLQEPICHHILPDEDQMRSTLNNHGFRILKFIDQQSQYELLAERCHHE